MYLGSILPKLLSNELQSDSCAILSCPGPALNTEISVSDLFGYYMTISHISITYS